MHADRVVAAAETYIGLVEFGVGVIPGGGGSKRTYCKNNEKVIADDVKTNRLRDAFMNIAMAKVATSAYEAYDMGILQKHKDIVVVNKTVRLLKLKQVALQLAEQGYTQPIKEKVKSTGTGCFGYVLCRN